MTMDKDMQSKGTTAASHLRQLVGVRREPGSDGRPLVKPDQSMTGGRFSSSHHQFYLHLAGVVLRVLMCSKTGPGYMQPPAELPTL